jgi:Putative beta-barrel porin 2
LKLAMVFGATASALAGAANAQTAIPVAHNDIRVSLTDAYETNTLRLSDSMPVPAGFAKNDFRTTPSVDFDLVRPVGLQSGFLKGNLGYDFYRKNKRLERERINVAAGFDLRVGECTQHAEIGISRQQSDLRDFTRAVGLRNAERRKAYSVSVGCASLFGLQPRISFDHQAVDNSTAFRKISNFNSNTYGVSLGYVSPVLGEFALFGSYRDGVYPNRFSRGPNPQTDGIEVFNGGLRYSRDIGARFKGNISAGFNKVRPKLAGVRGFSGPSFSAGLVWTASDQLRVTVDVSRQVSQSALLDVSYSIDDSYAIGASYAFNQALRARVGGSYLKRSFKDSPLTQPNLLGGQDRNTQVFGGLDYNPPGRIGFLADVTTARRSSQVNRFSYNYTTVRFGVRIGI